MLNGRYTLPLCCPGGRQLQYVIQTWNKISKTGLNEIPVPELLLWWLNIFGQDNCFRVWDLSPQPHRDKKEIIAPSPQPSIQIVQKPFCVQVYLHTHACASVHVFVHIFKVFFFFVWILVSDTTYDLTAAKRVQFVSDRMSYVIQRSNLSHITTLNFCIPTENKSSDTTDNFYDEHVFEYCHKYTVFM